MRRSLLYRRHIVRTFAALSQQTPSRRSDHTCCKRVMLADPVPAHYMLHGLVRGKVDCVRRSRAYNHTRHPSPQAGNALCRRHPICPLDDSIVHCRRGRVDDLHPSLLHHLVNFPGHLSFGMNEKVVFTLIASIGYINVCSCQDVSFVSLRLLRNISSGNRTAMPAKAPASMFCASEKFGGSDS